MWITHLGLSCLNQLHFFPWAADQRRDEWIDGSAREKNRGSEDHYCVSFPQGYLIVKKRITMYNHEIPGYIMLLTVTLWLSNIAMV